MDFHRSKQHKNPKNAEPVQGPSDDKSRPEFAVDTISFHKWCSFLAVSVLRTRTPFAHFLNSTLHLQRDTQVSASPAFPLPIPFEGIFAKMPPGLSSTKRRQVHFRRALHVVIMALNFWWAGSSFIPLKLLERTPSQSQRAIVRRLSGLLLADGPTDHFEVLGSGRRFPQLLARLGELSQCITKLGVGAGPYEKIYPGHDVPMDSSLFAELEPYKSLDASRLKVVGEGAFDATPFLGPELALAYRYPDSLLREYIPKPYEYPQVPDPASEVVKLAKLWDVRGLLYLHDVDLQHERHYELVRVFNCLKNETCDRQIGDRRGRNACECRVLGPSVDLPTGPDLLDLQVNVSEETLSVICTDRRDFYHQFATSRNRALSNSVGPVIALDEMIGTTAYEVFQSERRRRKPSRTAGGDGLGFSCRQGFKKCDKGFCMASFSSIFQGDHAGVEIATDAHTGLLQSVGLLSHQTRLVSSRPFQGSDLCEGLVIDDYFAIAKVPRGLLVADPAKGCLSTSKAVYGKHGIIGSDDKDIKGERRAKVIGAYVNASDQAQDRGHVLISAPPAKRYALAWVTFQMCQLTHTTDALHLCVLGGWTSILMYRRPLMSVLQKSFHLVDMDVFDASLPKMIRLPRAVATELVLLSVLAPLAVADVAADFCQDIFCTDASLEKGAILASPLDRSVMQVAWRCCRSKGGYSKLLSKEQVVLSKSTDFEEVEPVLEQKVTRPLAYRFAFIEIFAGAATVTQKVAALGFSVCNPIDISFDVELNMKHVHVLEWLLHLIQNHYVESFMIEPPCTTFSVMRRPPLRSREQPFGFDPSDPQTEDGTILAHRSFEVFDSGLRYGVTGVLENPWSSKIKFLPAWEILIAHAGCQLIRCDSCFYGSIHLKAFAFLCAWADIAPISGRCTGDHYHVPIQGASTKPSATYVDALSGALAQVMAIGIRRLRAFKESLDVPNAQGLENQLLNDLCVSLSWNLVSVWTFKVASHINVLELSVVVKLAGILVKAGKSVRVVVLVDSNVVRCAAAKGRSSSRALARALCRLAALCIAGGIYLSIGFAPTRLNPADDPTRDRDIRTASNGLGLSFWDPVDLYRLAAVPKLRRWISNWVRLVLCLLGPCALSFSDRSLYRSPAFPFGFPGAVDFPTEHLPHVRRQFDSTLGFPGEGPLGFFTGLFSCPFFLAVVWTLLGVGCHGVLIPRNAGDVQRQMLRMERPPLQEGRPVLAVTSEARASFLELFGRWLASIGFSLEDLLQHHIQYIEEINELLVKYGRNLYAVGRPYNHFAETINAVAAKKPAIRRQLQEAWNFAFAWVREEPSTHHIALPWQILLAALSVSLLWGWLDMAGMLALTWGALLRVGEFTQAVRSDLLLPVDTNFTNSFALLALKEPKTRFTAARHQSAKLDIPDLLKIVHLAFSRLKPFQKLWPKSGQTLRVRFRQILLELGIGPNTKLNGKGLDLGSLRPGGATWMIQQCEDPTFTRRRGRWVNEKTMEIYIQEISCFQFLTVLSDNARAKVYTLCEAFPWFSLQAEQLWQANVPANVWYQVLSRQVTRD